MKKPFRIAFAVQDHSVNVLVKITTDEGLWGIGEAAPFEPVTGESTATVLAETLVVGEVPQAAVLRSS